MNFSLDNHLDTFYTRFPEGNRQPVIGLTANFNDGNALLSERYYQQVIDAGGTPMLIPPTASPDVLINILDHIDGLLLTGGADINPLWAGEQPSTHLHGINAKRDLSELLLTQLAYNRQIPILGICRGIQTIVTALGGKVQQDIYEDYIPHATMPERSKGGATQGSPFAPATIKHSQDADRSEPTHSVQVVAGTLLAGIYHADTLYVNSFHHQAVKETGKRFRISAKSTDGVIEAIESREFKSIIGVQWHPECLGAEGGKLFAWLVDQARCFNNAKRIHSKILTLDTHCDTPMFFPQGVAFDQRDARILVDLHKMTDGRQDAVTMAAYLPQPNIGETFSSKIDLAGIMKYNPQLASKYIRRKAGATAKDPEQLSISPLQYADMIFDKIEETVKQNSRYLSIARTPSDVYEDKRKGRKSILFAIENGLALEGNLANVKYFAQRGVTYITLCHNGDNDICDSARGCNTHGGVSRFGRQVIEEMNRNGIMVDLSHGAEKSFWDALEISATPIVCSHANCRALCDHPRNLTDDQLRALAKKGGVAHITMYHGFLKKEGEATVRDALAHLEHAIEVAGIDHVGIGTDFDGDGGVRGFADASEMIRFTMHLMRRKYSEKDIEKIWGGNWLRVMAKVQRQR